MSASISAPATRLIAPSLITHSLIALPLLTLSGGAAAQSNQGAPILVPGLDNFTLPGVPAQAPAPPPAPTPTPQPSATPVVRPVPRPTPPVVRTTPKPSPIPSQPAAIPAPTPTPTVLPPVLPVPVASASAPPQPAAPATDEPATSPSSLYWLLGAGIVLLLTGLAWLAARRRPPREMQNIDILPGHADVTPDDLPTPTPPVVPRPAAQPAAAPRPWIDLAFHPRRAGTNVLSAAVDYEIGIRNTGAAPATGIRLDIRLLSAAADQDAMLTALFAAPVDRPAVAPFDLPAGAEVTTTGMAMLPQELINVLTMRDRPHFVPLLAVNVRYGWAGGNEEGQTAAAYVVGIERPDGGKMAPFRLDSGPRMQDGVGQRPHDLAIRR